MLKSSRLIPLVVACPMFLQNISVSALNIALPSIATSFGAPVIKLNVVVTAYLLSLAVFLPMSAWLADRFGAKQLLCAAIGLFVVASFLCGLSGTVSVLVLCRIAQGMASALMLPIGRLILLRSVPESELISAMIWYTVPPVIGRLAGPLIGGTIVTVTSWRWIFFVNVPFGIVAMTLAFFLLQDVKADQSSPFDFGGFVLMSLGLAATLGALDTLGKDLVAPSVSALAAVVGVLSLALYGIRSWRQENPLIDLQILRYRTYRANVLGAAPLRLAISAVPFLLPLMLQVTLGLSPVMTGLLFAGSALGALCTRGVMRKAIARFGFRKLLFGATLLTSLTYTSYSLFSASTLHMIMFLTLFLGGLLSSLCMVCLNTFGYAELPKDRISHATALISMAQQLTASAGVVIAASLLTLFSRLGGGDGVHLRTIDFSAALAAGGMFILVSLVSFARLGPDKRADVRAAAMANPGV